MPDLQSQVVFDEFKRRIDADSGLVKKIGAVYVWVVTDKGKEVVRYTVDLKTGTGSVYEGDPKAGVKAGVTLTVDDADMVKMVDGSLNPQKAFMTGKLKLKGNLLLTQKLQALFNAEKSKL